MSLLNTWLACQVHELGFGMSVYELQHDSIWLFMREFSAFPICINTFRFVACSCVLCGSANASR